MRYYKKILVSENNRRLKKLYDFRALLLDYFNNSHSEWQVTGRVKENQAKDARIKINRVLDEVYDIIIYSGVNPTTTWSPPPIVGGYIREIDLIQNIFNIHSHDIDADYVLDIIDRSIGIYETNHSAALIRTFNPFFYIGLIIDFISAVPFMAIGKLGFNRKKAETSFIGKFIKGFLFLITVIAAFLTILQLLELLEPIKQLTHEIVNSMRT